MRGKMGPRPSRNCGSVVLEFQRVLTGLILAVLPSCNQKPPPTPPPATQPSPTAEAEAEWVATIRSLAYLNTAFFEACTPGYYNNEGKVGEPGGFISEIYAPGANAFNELLGQWRETGELTGLELHFGNVAKED